MTRISRIFRSNDLAQSRRGDKSMRCTERNENPVPECWNVKAGDLAGQARHDRNLQGAGSRAGDVAQSEPRWRSTSRSRGSRWRIESRLCLSLGALRFLAIGISRNESAVGDV